MDVAKSYVLTIFLVPYQNLLHLAANQSFELSSSPLKTLLDSCGKSTLMAKVRALIIALTATTTATVAQQILLSNALSVCCIVIKHPYSSNLLPQFAHHFHVIFLFALCTTLKSWATLSSTLRSSSAMSPLVARTATVKLHFQLRNFDFSPSNG